ncbi:hypothetical protein CFC21_027114 [Triticum aestivum]|uniref:Cytochrome P450 n=2 Tax=Triticum aestivum TaxID=4565 RepID=A0A9R1ENH4_WHEAT|nr:hypothetical protein CFC21_027114 [Triticum aestivum]
MSILFSQELPIYTALVLLVPLYYLYSRVRCRSGNPALVLPTNWPILHMFPSFLANIHNLHKYLTLVLAGSGHNFRAHGPPGTGLRFFVTCDPTNVRHIFTTNYTNFPKGAEFADIFDIVGGSLLTIDGEPSREQRAKVKGALSNPWMAATMASCCCDKDMLPMDAAVALDTFMEVGFSLLMTPSSCWKLMRWLNIGPERKLKVARIVLLEFAAEMMERRKMNPCFVGNEDEQEDGDILSSFLNDPDYADDDLLRAMIIAYMFAARDTVGTTVTWIFYNLAQNPNIVSNIRKELSPIASRKAAVGVDAMSIFEPEETRSLVYLKAVLYETLRLYPAAPLECKTVIADDIMPSGHEVHAGDTIIISIHSMGRMEGVWGEDCLHYKPDRWLSVGGNNMRYVPSHKFLAFNSGPRMCLGKDIAIMQMKTVIASTLWNLDVEVMEGQTIQPKQACIQQMKNVLIVKLKKREM